MTPLRRAAAGGGPLPRAGRSTAAVYWPVTGLNAGIDDLIDEYFFPYYGETPEEAFAKLGAREAALEAVRENLCRFPYHFQKGLPLTRENTFDDFVNGCACSLIRRRRPDLLMLHNCYLDSLRHRFGVFAPQIREGLDLMDLWLGELMEAMEDAGVYDRTNFVILSDHGQMNFVRRVKLNCLLARGGFIDQDGAGQVTDWRAFAQSNGMSATIYIKEGAGKALEREVGDFLRGLAREGVWGFQEVLTRREARRRYGMYGPFAFMVETDGYTAFSDSWEEPLLADADPADYRLGQATHGYQPEKGPQPQQAAQPVRLPSGGGPAQGPPGGRGPHPGKGPGCGYAGGRRRLPGRPAGVPPLTGGGTDLQKICAGMSRFFSKTPARNC